MDPRADSRIIRALDLREMQQPQPRLSVDLSRMQHAEIFSIRITTPAATAFANIVSARILHSKCCWQRNLQGGKWAVFCLFGVVLSLLFSSCSIGPCGVSWIWSGSSTSAPPETNQVLTASQYAAADVVYRTFLPGGQWPEAKTNFVYCLSFGGVDVPVPADFIARFANPMPTVITGTNGLVIRPGVTLEPKSGREVIRLTLTRLSIHNTQADALVFYVGGSEVVTETLWLKQQDGLWSVARMNELVRSYF